MSQAADLTPAIDATVESQFIGWDFGLILGPSVAISSVASLTCVVDSGTDSLPATRLIGSSIIVASNATGAPAGAVAQKVGGMIAGVTYLLQCVVHTSDGQDLSLWARLPCISPR